MSLTPEQQAAALAETSVAVTAGAGTGKTYMLAERYLYYLRDRDYSPLEIVATTFTEKAAKELRSRIRTLVSQQMSDRADLVAELEAAQISTIHALAARICREHPESAGVPYDFTIIDELEGKLWQSDRLDDALNKLPDRLYERIPYSLMRDSLERLLKDPISGDRALKQGTQHWQDIAERLRKQTVRELFNSLKRPDVQEAIDVLHSYFGDKSDKLEQIRQDVLDGIAKLEHYIEKLNSEAGYESLSTLRSILAVFDSIKLTVGSKKKWKYGGLQDVKDAIKLIRAPFKDSKYRDVLTLELGEIDRQFSEILPDLQAAFQFVCEELDRAKTRNRVLDYADLEIRALRALTDPKVRDYYRQRWQVFLVDEVQDTNPIQAELINAIAPETELTIVGDIKQSIYGFRRADVGVFDRLRDRILAANGSEVGLTKSFRAHQSLIHDINRIFKPILGTSHQNLEAHCQEPPHPRPHLEVYAIDADKSINKPQREAAEAHHIASLLKDLLETQTPIRDKRNQTLRPITPGDIAILSRTWSPIETYGEALETAGIPYVIAGGGNLLESRVVKDARSLLQFLVDPGDNLALIATLRSPFFAISDRRLYDIATTQSNSHKTTWWERIQQYDWGENSPVPVLKELLSQRNLEPPTRLLQLADRNTGYTAVLANLPHPDRRDADWRGFRDLLRNLEVGSGDLFGVMRRLKRLIDSDIRIPRLPVNAQNAVTLSTIHSAKGLEWSTVVVADLARSRSNSTESIYFDPEIGVGLKLDDDAGETQLPAIYRYLQQQKQRQEAEEALRILYVALTRSRDRLILTATHPDDGNLALLRPGLDAAGIEIHPWSVEELPPISPGSGGEPPSAPTPPVLLDSVGSGIFELPVTALSVYHRCPKQFEFQFVLGHPGAGEGAAESRTVGELTHMALEHKIRDVEVLARYRPEVPHTWLEDAVTLARNFDQAEVFSRFRGGEVERERPVSLVLEGLRLNGTADLVGKDWVLDYKTDSEVIPASHRFQLWAYATALERREAHIAYLRHNRLYEMDAKELEASGSEVQSVVRGILNGDYTAKPDSRKCGECPYCEICEDRS